MAEWKERDRASGLGVRRDGAEPQFTAQAPWTPSETKFGIRFWGWVVPEVRSGHLRDRGGAVTGESSRVIKNCPCWGWGSVFT